ncbi:MAG: type I-U CRISPR-associated protein Csb2 [Caldilineaceae bacterium]|nr:type I-U CRISPR-associated protein Csb2 [Caldilineaceae bacterium]
MITIRLTFPSGQYTAVQRGRNGRDAVLEWPPSPWTLLKALSEAWHCSLPAVSPEAFAATLEALARTPPCFRLPHATPEPCSSSLPDGNPSNPEDQHVNERVSLRVQGSMIICWPDTDLSSNLREAFQRMLPHWTQLGPASEVQVELQSEPPSDFNAVPVKTGSLPTGSWDLVPTLTVRPPLRIADLLGGRIEHADTTDCPEGAEWMIYARASECLGTGQNIGHASTGLDPVITVVRFALTGPMLPEVTETLRWGDLARRSVMAQYGRQNGGRSTPTLSGKDASGKPLQGHRHAFYMPIDEDGDGLLDHLTIWTPIGFNAPELRAVEGVRSLNPGSGKHPIRLEVLGHGEAADFGSVCPWLFGESRHWHSLTPYVLTRHVKYRGPKDELGRRRIVDGPEEQMLREAGQRWPEGPQLLQAAEVTSPEDPRLAPLKTGISSSRLPSEFLRKRQRGSSGGRACKFMLEFEEPVTGPIALGHGCHYGLGLFVC